MSRDFIARLNEKSRGVAESSNYFVVHKSHGEKLDWRELELSRSKLSRAATKTIKKERGNVRGNKTSSNYNLSESTQANMYNMTHEMTLMRWLFFNLNLKYH